MYSLFLIGCFVVEPSKSPLALDDDGDGYSEFEGDCNDQDDSVYPGAVTEAIYNQCMIDLDGDGYGNMGVTAPYDAGTDCDDYNPLAFPGAA